MTFIKKQSKNLIIISKYFLFIFISSNLLTSHQTLAQESYKLNEMEIDRIVNSEDDGNFDFPTNPFEIVDRLRRANSMNEATKPSDAIDDAIKSFDMIKEEKQI